MGRQVIIKTPFPSLDETARELGMSQADVERVQQLLRQKEPGKRARANGHRLTVKYARKKASKKV